MVKLDEYRKIVGDNVIDELHFLSERVSGKVIQNINSTAVGGGVAEILNRMIPLLKELNVNIGWSVIKGDEKFFVITKKIHNALHSARVEITDEELNYFLEVNRKNAEGINFYGDIIFIHDPQPAALIEKKRKTKKKWVWRCHIDFSKPDKRIWLFLKNYIKKYDTVVFSAPSFGRDISTKQVLISPSIDPLSDKNKKLSKKFIDSVFEGYGIDRKRPIITQISRFDYLKDPIGVIRTYRLVKKHMDCQLVLAGGGATDDPEGKKVLQAVRGEAEGDKDIFVLHLPPASHLEINALQRGSTIIIQKSLQEGFGLTVSEALWKAKPVIASAVGGIPLQIIHGYSGILTHTIEGTAHWIKQLLCDAKYAKKLGENGKEHIKDNFLITRHIRDYLLLFLSLYHKEDIVYL
jgi:trehalose synthase